MRAGRPARGRGPFAGGPRRGKRLVNAGIHFLTVQRVISILAARLPGTGSRALQARWEAPLFLRRKFMELGH